MTDTVIALNGIAKHSGRTHVLKEVNLTVRRGETSAFLGRNGAGKTTTIRMMLGLTLLLSYASSAILAALLRQHNADRRHNGVGLAGDPA